VISRRFKTLAAIVLAAVTASAQDPDTSANGVLKGPYFVREVLMTGNLDGSVTTAGSAIGIATFDGNGNYTFTGQGTSLTSGPNSALSLSGAYTVGSNGFFQMQSLADPTDTEFGGVSSLGPSAFVASATEDSNVTMMVGIPIGSSVSNASFKGNYTAGAIDFPNAGIASVREAAFNLTADGAGNLGNVAISGAGANLGGTLLTQTDSGATYSLSAGGSGTINFGAAAGSQLVSGTKTFYISADGSIVLAGSPTGYDMLIGIQALAGGASNAIANQLYYMGGLEDAIQQPTNAIDGFYGSETANGAGTSIYHNRINSLVSPVFDYTFDTMYTIAPNGTVPIGSGQPYSYTFGVNGQAFVATGDVINSGFYSLTLGLGMAKCVGSGVYLCDNGIVNLANSAPITNPIAPNELISLSGTGFTTTAVGASSLPLPMSLGNVTVTINGVPAPLDYVSPTQIIALVPSSISPNNNAAYATLQVTSNNVPSNLVTVYTNNTAPGVFANPAAVGAAAAQHGGGIAVTSSNPANIGEEIAVYVGGLGAVSPAVVPDGAPAPGPPNLSVAIDPGIDVDFGDPQAPTSVVFAGLTPTETGLYQINVVVPVGTSSNSFFDVSTTDGYTSEAVLSVAGTTGSAEEKSVKPAGERATVQATRRRPSGVAKAKKAGLRERVQQLLP
jgi:uncharacterized protein (TIGR03437 family)